MPSRREFLRTAALAAAGTPFLGSRLARGLSAARDDRLGFALVGLGQLSTYQLAPALQKTEHCRLAAIVTGTPAKAARWKARYGIPDRSIYDYDSMVRLQDNPDVDVVYVVTPNALHMDPTIKAARAGKHVLCEKPMEVSVERCQAMIDACRQAGRQLAIGYRCHFDPNHQEAVRLARQNVLGRVKLIEAGFAGVKADPNQWRFNRALAGGGPLVDLGIYALQTTRMLTGQEPTSVSARSSTTDPVKFKEIEESIVWQLSFPDGVLATCSTSYNARGPNRFTAYADRGSFGMEPAYNYGGNRGWRSDNQPLSFPQIDQFAAEMDDFARCIKSGTPTSVPGEEGLRDVRIITAIYEAARTGNGVRLPSA